MHGCRCLQYSNAVLKDCGAVKIRKRILQRQPPAARRKASPPGRSPHDPDAVCGKNTVKGEHGMKYVCDLCGWEYDETVGDPDNGIAPGTKFEDLPEDFECPLCGAGKDSFSKAE